MRSEFTDINIIDDLPIYIEGLTPLLKKIALSLKRVERILRLKAEWYLRNITKEITQDEVVVNFKIVGCNKIDFDGEYIEKEIIYELRIKNTDQRKRDRTLESSITYDPDAPYEADLKKSEANKLEKCFPHIEIFVKLKGIEEKFRGEIEDILSSSAKK